MPTPINNVLMFLVSTITNLIIIVFILRLLMQWARMDFYNPIAQFVFRVTNPLTAPLQRILPRSRFVDIAGLIVLLVVTAAANFLLLGLRNYPYTVPEFAYYLVAKIINLALLVYIVFIIVIAVMSWFAPAAHSPISDAIRRLVEPVMRPFRRIIPTFEGIDLSPLVAIICLSAVRILFSLPPVLS